MKFPYTLIIGSKEVKIEAWDKSGISIIEIYVDGKLMETLKVIHGHGGDTLVILLQQPITIKA